VLLNLVFMVGARRVQSVTIGTQAALPSNATSSKPKARNGR
jgi:hypothetical protein